MGGGGFETGLPEKSENAGVAQQAEQRIVNPQGVGSTPTTSATTYLEDTS